MLIVLTWASKITVKRIIKRKTRISSLHLYIYYAVLSVTIAPPKKNQVIRKNSVKSVITSNQAKIK